MRRLVVCLVACSMVLGVIGGCRPRTLPEDRGRAVLKDIRDAQRTVPLKGRIHTKIRIGDELVSAEAKVHRGDGRMQLGFTSGKADGAKIVQQKGNVWQISPGGETVRRLPHNPVDTPLKLGRKMEVTTQPGGQVAGRATMKVTVIPENQAGARLEIWADRRTDFPLRMDRYNARGRLVSSTVYDEVAFGVQPPESVKRAEDPESLPRGVFRIDKQQAAKILKQEPIQPEYLPEGFEFRGYYLHKNPKRKAVVLRYSDGLHPLNILQIRPPERRSGSEGGKKAGKPGSAERRTKRGVGRDDRAREDGRPPGARAKQRAKGGLAQDGDRPRRQFRGQRPGMDGKTKLGKGPRVQEQRVRGRIVRFRRGELVIVVQGELPPEELRKVAAGLQENAIGF